MIIENCINNGEVTISGGIQNNIGVCGIAGRVGTNGKIVNCVNNAAINSETSSAAGIALVTECSVKGCTNNGNITAGNGSAAGIACELSGGGIITECINNGKITENLGSANYNYSGGIVANCKGSSTAVSTVSKCINTGDVSGYNNVGGITGYVYHTNISLCGNIGKVTGTNNYVGGVTSQLGMGSTIENCYNLGNVSAADNVGGLVGTFTLILTLDYGNNSVSNSYASCKVTATGENATAIGGLSGSLPSITKNGNTYKSTLKDSIYDTTKYTGEAYGSTDDENSTTGEALNLQGVTAAQFKSGEVCYILNGQTSESTDENSLVWGQHIGKEDYPVFGGKIVYLSDGIYHNEIEEFVILQNSANNGNAVAKIAVPTAGTYTVVFADYEGGALKSVNMVEVTSAGGEIVTATSTEPITLGSKDKIMLWSDLNKFTPKCNAYVID